MTHQFSCATQKVSVCLLSTTLVATSQLRHQQTTTSLPTFIGVRARSDLGGRRPVCPKKLRSAPLLDCRNQLFTPSKCTKKHAFTIVERHKIVRNRNTVFRTSHTLCRFTRSSNDRVTKQATRCSKCQRSTEQQQSIKCFKIHSKDLLQNNDFHITSSIFLLSSVLVFYFFLILFFNSIVYRFFIARIFGVLPEYFRDWGGCRPPPRPPGSYAYADFARIRFIFK